jgi:integrase
LSARPAEAGAHSPVSGRHVQQVEAGAEHGDATARGAALLLYPGPEARRSAAETPYPKKVLHLPHVLSQEEVTCLIDAAEMPFHRILLMTLYATGARRAEVAHFKVSDIDSQRMVVHIRGGKGRKDRDVMLSPALLDALRVYWRGLRRKPTDWLFPGGAAWDGYWGSNGTENPHSLQADDRRVVSRGPAVNRRCGPCCARA